MDVPTLVYGTTRNLFRRSPTGAEALPTAIPMNGVRRGVGRGAQGQELGAFCGAAVAGGLAAQTACEPGAEECGRPAQFGCCGLPAGRDRPWRQRERPGVIASGQVNGVGDGCGDPLVAQGTRVESVSAPQPWVGGDGVPGGFGDRYPVPGGRSADAGVEVEHAGPDWPGKWRDLPDIGEGESHYMGPGGCERGEHFFQMPGHLRGVEPGPEQVVDPGNDGGQVGAQGQGWPQLFGADPAGDTSSYGQIGVLERGVDGREVLGESIGPAP